MASAAEARAGQPPDMPYAARAFTCPCGAVFTARAAAGSTPECVECRVERSAQRTLDLHRKSGPGWSAWLAAMHKLTGCPLAECAVDVRAVAAEVARAWERETPSPSPPG